eukprot:7536878-Pyramimonas_sp.AAC.1
MFNTICINSIVVAVAITIIVITITMSLCITSTTMTIIIIITTVTINTISDETISRNGFARANSLFACRAGWSAESRAGLPGSLRVVRIPLVLMTLVRILLRSVTVVRVF